MTLKATTNTGEATLTVGQTWRWPASYAPPRIKRSVFNAYKALIFDAAGINLTEKKVSLLEGRLSRRMRALGIGKFEDYLAYLDNGRNTPEMVLMLDCVSTNETSFFREPHQYTFLEQQVYPRLRATGEAGRRPKRIKVWSAACSTGDELYSAAMGLLNHFPVAQGWTIDAIGTDISTRVLNLALQGIWPQERSKTIPKGYLKRFMLRGTGSHEETMAAGEELRNAVRFRRLNLFTDSFGDMRDFDIIFCRNVMIYFNQESKFTVINKLLDSLAPGGYFLVGHAETLHGMDNRLQRHVPTVYSKR